MVGRAVAVALIEREGQSAAAGQIEGLIGLEHGRLRFSLARVDRPCRFRIAVDGGRDRPTAETRLRETGGGVVQPHRLRLRRPVARRGGHAEFAQCEIAVEGPARTAGGQLRIVEDFQPDSA